VAARGFHPPRLACKWTRRRDVLLQNSWASFRSLECPLLPVSPISPSLLAELIHHARPPLPHLAALPAPAPTTFVRPPRLPAQVVRAASPSPRPARRCILEVIILFSRQSATVAQHGSEQRQARGVHRPRCVCEGRALSVMGPDALSAYGASDAAPEHFSKARMANNAF
jgi:hypothetical protein